MIVCVCHRVSDRDIRRAVEQGCLSFDALQEEFRIATACGACHDCACSVFEEALSIDAPKGGRDKRVMPILLAA